MSYRINYLQFDDTVRHGTVHFTNGVEADFELSAHFVQPGVLEARAFGVLLLFGQVGVHIDQVTLRRVALGGPGMVMVMWEACKGRWWTMRDGESG